MLVLTESQAHQISKIIHEHHDAYVIRDNVLYALAEIGGSKWTRRPTKRWEQDVKKLKQEVHDLEAKNEQLKKQSAIERKRHIQRVDQQRYSWQRMARVIWKFLHQPGTFRQIEERMYKEEIEFQESDCEYQLNQTRSKLREKLDHKEEKSIPTGNPYKYVTIQAVDLRSQDTVPCSIQWDAQLLPNLSESQWSRLESLFNRDIPESEINSFAQHNLNPNIELKFHRTPCGFTINDSTSVEEYLSANID